MKMKKAIILLAVSFTVVISHAQVKFGVKGGLNIATIVGKYVEGYTSKVGIHLGGLANLPLTSKLSAQGEVYYSMQGANWDGEGKSSLNYLQIPVMVKYNFTPQIFAEAGPQIGLLVSAKDTYDGESTDIKEFLESTDLSLAIGGGYNVNSRLSIYARYNVGFSKIYISEKNRVGQVGVNYMF